MKNKDCLDTRIRFPNFGSGVSQELENPIFKDHLSPCAQDRERCVAMCDGVIDILSALFNVSGRQLRTQSRTTRSIGRIRQIGMYVANTSLGINLTMIGRGFGRNKSTVVHACHLIEDMRDDADFDRIINRVEQIVCAAFNAGKASSEWQRDQRAENDE